MPPPPNATARSWFPVLLVTGAQLAPPFVVRRMTPLSPVMSPTDGSRKATSCRSWGTRLTGVQVWPALAVTMAAPALPTAQPAAVVRNQTAFRSSAVPLACGTQFWAGAEPAIPAVKKVASARPAQVERDIFDSSGFGVGEAGTRRRRGSTRPGDRRGSRVL